MIFRFSSYILINMIKTEQKQNTLKRGKKMTNITNITKKDQIKKTIMDTLNKAGEAVDSKDIKIACKDLGSARTILRALGELKLEAKVVQDKSLYTSLTPKETPKEKEEAAQDADFIKDLKKGAAVTDSGKADLSKQIDTMIGKKADPKDCKWFGFNHNDTFVCGHPTKKAATAELTLYTKETGNAVKLISKGQLTPDQAKAAGIELPKAETPKKGKKGKKGKKNADSKKGTTDPKGKKDSKKSSKKSTKKADPKPDPKKKKGITKDSLKDAAKSGQTRGNTGTVTRNPAPPKKTKGIAKGDRVDQTGLIRDGIAKGKTPEWIMKKLEREMKKAGWADKDAKWAKSRFATYAKAYGADGSKDSKLNK